MKLKLTLLFFAFALLAFSQAVYIEIPPVTTVSGNPPSGSFPTLLAASGAKVSVCTYPSCAALVTTYTDATGVTPCPTTHQLVLPGTSTCTDKTDNRGNAGFWSATGGQYQYKITLANGKVYGPYPVTMQTNNAANVQVVEPDSGATPQNAQAKLTLSTPRTPQSFGAVCDGVYSGSGWTGTDDGPKLQKMFDAAAYGNAKLQFPQGVCLSAQSLLYYNNFEAKGASGFQWDISNPNAQSGIAAHPSFPAGQPLIQPADTSANTINVYFDNLLFDGNGKADPVVSWYRTSYGRISDSIITDSLGKAGARGLVVDANVVNAAYFNRFVQLKTDGLKGSGIIFQNGANHNFVIGGKDTIGGADIPTHWGLQVLSGSTPITIDGWTCEDVGTGSCINRQSSDTRVLNGYFENAANGIVDGPVASAGSIQNNHWAMSALNPYTPNASMLGFTFVHQLFPTGGGVSGRHYLGPWNMDVDNSSVVSSVDIGLIPELGTSNLEYRVGRNITTSGTRNFRFYKHDGTASLAANLNLANGDWSASGIGSFGGNVTGHNGYTGFTNVDAITYRAKWPFFNVDVASSSGTTAVYLDPAPQLGTSDLFINFFRCANTACSTSGAGRFTLFKPNTSTMMYDFDVQNGILTLPAGMTFRYNAGSPEGAVTAVVGSLVSDIGNGLLWLKYSGSGNTGWRSIPTSGLSATKTVKGSDGANCNLVFTNGVLTSTTCP